VVDREEQNETAHARHPAHRYNKVDSPVDLGQKFVLAELAARSAPHRDGSPQYFSIQFTTSLIVSLRGIMCDES
jgi:hypothetical protein